jgi:hypothetical protein
MIVPETDEQVEILTLVGLQLVEPGGLGPPSSRA